MLFSQIIVNGITVGGIYALTALGYTMVYGILLMINFAHSEVFMLGAYFGLTSMYLFGNIPFIKENPPLFLLLIFFSVMLLSGLLGMSIERIAYRPLRHAPRLAPLISAIGVSIFLQNLVMVIVGSQSKEFPPSEFAFLVPNITYQIGGVIISFLQIFIILVSIFLMVILTLLIKKTKLGRAMRACAQDREVASLMGINVNRIISATFFIGGSLGGAAGMLQGMYYGSIKYNMGFIPGIKAFTCAVLGGIGNIPGAMLGGFILGIAENLGASYVSSEYKDFIAFAILILILIFKPTGLLGERIVERT